MRAEHEARVKPLRDLEAKARRARPKKDPKEPTTTIAVIKPRIFEDAGYVDLVGTAYAEYSRLPDVVELRNRSIVLTLTARGARELAFQLIEAASEATDFNGYCRACEAYERTIAKRAAAAKGSE